MVNTAIIIPLQNGANLIHPPTESLQQVQRQPQLFRESRKDPPSLSRSKKSNEDVGDVYEEWFMKRRRLDKRIDDLMDRDYYPNLSNYGSFKRESIQTKNSHFKKNYFQNNTMREEIYGKKLLPKIQNCQNTTILYFNRILIIKKPFQNSLKIVFILTFTTNSTIIYALQPIFRSKCSKLKENANLPQNLLWIPNRKSINTSFIIFFLSIIGGIDVIQSFSGFCLRYLSKSSYLEFSIFLYFSANPYMLMLPAESPEMMAEPSLFQMHLFWAFLFTFSWAMGIQRSRVRSKISRQPSLLTVANKLGLFGFQLTSQMQSSEFQKVRRESLESGCHNFTVQSQELVKTKLLSSSNSEGLLMDNPLMGPLCSSSMAIFSFPLLWSAFLQSTPLSDPVQQLLASPSGKRQQVMLMSCTSSLLVRSKIEEVFDTIELSGLSDLLAERVVLSADALAACALWDRPALSLFMRVGLLNCLMSQMHIMPSLEQETMLLAIWVPTTFREQTGYLWASAEMPERWTGIDLARMSHKRIWPLQQPPRTVELEKGQNFAEVTAD